MASGVPIVLQSPGQPMQHPPHLQCVMLDKEIGNRKIVVVIIIDMMIVRINFLFVMYFDVFNYLNILCIWG